MPTQENNNKITNFVIVIITIIILFLVGWIVGKLNIFVQKNNDTTDNQITSQKDVLDYIQKVLAPQLIAKLEGNPTELPALQTCTTKDNCTNEMQTPPYQWLRYAQYYHAKAFLQPIPTTEILDDLMPYTDEEYYLKLYQYGDIILASDNIDKKYQERYLKIFDNSLHPSYFSTDEIYSYYTENNPIDKEELLGGQITKNRNNLELATDYSNNAMTAANAYILTKDKKYLNAINNLLSQLSTINFFESNIANTTPNSPKNSVCHYLLASVKAYSVTQDQQYLQLNKDVILGKENYLQQVFSLNSAQIDESNSIPLHILPCLDALNLLMVEDKQNFTTYDSTYKIIINFLFDNKIINTNKDTDFFGMLYYKQEYLDINASSWLIKILSEKSLFTNDE